MTRPASGARIQDSVFDRAADKVSIADYCERNGAKLARAGQDLRGPCILCDGGTTKFRVLAKAGLRRFRCYGCDAHGDVCDLVAMHRRCEPHEAARWLLGEDVPVSAPQAREAPKAEGPKTSDRVAAEIWREARPIEGSLAERYLLGRGIAREVLDSVAANLRYHGAAKHHWDPQAGAWTRAPAMVAQVVAAGPDGEPQPTGGVHCTYLDRASAGKARLTLPDGRPAAAKLMWGPQHLSGRPGGAWLNGPLDPVIRRTDLVVAEGIETALSVASLALMRQGRAMRACAALSLGRLQGGILRDEDGCFDPARAQGDPEMPAFTWPAPADDPWPRVVIAVDRDMAEVRIWSRTGRGRPCPMRLSREDRARLCARLAADAWRAAGAAKVRAIAPPPGRDFNDELRRVLAAGSDA